MSLFSSIFNSDKEKDTPKEDKYPRPLIKRTRLLEGKYVYSVICNGGSYFMIDLPVYEDAVFDCWEHVDYNGLKAKIEQGWLTPVIPDGEHFSIHHLGSWVVKNSNWMYSKDDYAEYLISEVSTMNPDLVNLYHAGEASSKIIGNTNYSVYGNSSKHLVRQDEATPSFNEFTGKREHYFFKDSSGTYHLANVNFYMDSVILVEGIPSKQTMSVDKFKELAKSGAFVCELPKDAEVHVENLGSFVVAETRFSADIKSKLLEIDDILARLKGEPTSSDICYELYEKYQKHPSEELAQQLKVAYEHIPVHLRHYVLGDMDAKDWPIRAIIYHGEK